MDIDLEVSESWLNASSTSTFTDRLHLVETLADQLGPIAVAGLRLTMVSEISQAGPPEVVQSVLPRELQGTMDIRITIRPPAHFGSWHNCQLYMTDILTHTYKVLSGIFEEMKDAPVMKVRVRPVESCEIVLKHGQPVPGSELGTLYRG